MKMNVAIGEECNESFAQNRAVEVMNAKIEPYEMYQLPRKFEPKVFLQNTVLIAQNEKKLRSQTKSNSRVSGEGKPNKKKQ
jgi:hypothetical protein